MINGNRLEVPFEFPYTERMKIKDTDEEIIKAAKVMKKFYTKMAERYAGEDSAKTYNMIRLEMRNVIVALEELAGTY